MITDPRELCYGCREIQQARFFGLAGDDLYELVFEIKKLSDSRGDAALCSDIVRDAYGHLQKARPVEIHDEEGRDVTDPARVHCPRCGRVRGRWIRCGNPDCRIRCASPWHIGASDRFHVICGNIQRIKESGFAQGMMWLADVTSGLVDTMYPVDLGMAGPPRYGPIHLEGSPDP